MHADAVVPSYEAAWITAIPEDVEICRCRRLCRCNMAVLYCQHSPKRSRYAVRYLLEKCVREPSSIWVSEAAEKWVAAKSPTYKAHG
jgi:hypothetical protein